MLVSLRHRLVVLAMPKCASTAIEAAIADRMDVVINRHPGAKHTPFRKYDRFLRRYFETYTDGPLEVVSLFREPEDWVRSWWRYRSRDGISDPHRSAQGWTFERFAAAYVDGLPGPASVGSQARFVSTKDDTLGCDRVFRYEALPVFVDWLAQRLEAPITLDRINASPVAREDADLTAQTRLKLHEALAREFEIYRSL